MANGANILENHEFVNRETSRFYMRTAFVGSARRRSLVKDLRQALPDGASVRLGRSGPPRVVVLATREPHCLGEILLRHSTAVLGASVEAVVSNHDVLAQLVERFDVPFHHVSHLGCDRDSHENAIHRVLERYRPDYIVLAKYMRILSSAFIAKYPHHIINIHHSFLPAFVGANPYRQAFQRGVKIIGATAHFVTAELDDGPIVAQGIEPVDHSASVVDLAAVGRDIEKVVLARAMKLIFDDRVFICGNRTIVFQ